MSVVRNKTEMIMIINELKEKHINTKLKEEVKLNGVKKCWSWQRCTLFLMYKYIP